MQAVELFAGAGGASLGLVAAGYEEVRAIEWDAAACATRRAAGLRCDEGDVRDPALIADVGDIDLLWSSFPCQAWSSAGKRLGAQDARNGWPWTVAALDRVRPRWFIAENVPGLTHHRGVRWVRSRRGMPGMLLHSDDSARGGGAIRVVGLGGAKCLVVRCPTTPPPHLHRRWPVTGPLARADPRRPPGLSARGSVRGSAVAVGDCAAGAGTGRSSLLRRREPQARHGSMEAGGRVRQASGDGERHAELNGGALHRPFLPPAVAPDARSRPSSRHGAGCGWRGAEAASHGSGAPTSASRPDGSERRS